SWTALWLFGLNLLTIGLLLLCGGVLVLQPGNRTASRYHGARQPPPGRGLQKRLNQQPPQVADQHRRPVMVVVTIFSIICLVIAWLRSRDRAGTPPSWRA